MSLPVLRSVRDGTGSLKILESTAVAMPWAAECFRPLPALFDKSQDNFFVWTTLPVTPLVLQLYGENSAKSMILIISGGGVP